jgi:lipopolysaccharide/colanic/teichoic acid biosynthesis glycosyltransferase
VFYRQSRVGLHGDLFDMIKFRSMVVGADRLRTALEASNELDGVLFKIREDPRVTAFGRFMRRYSIDEAEVTYWGTCPSCTTPQPHHQRSENSAC